MNEQAPATGAQAPITGQGAPKKSNTCLIVVIVVSVILILLGVGGYFVYRYLKGKVKTAVENTATTTSSTSTSTTTSGETTDQTAKNDYNNTNAVSPTTDSGKKYSAEIGAILTPIFGGAKLSDWMDLSGGQSMGFIVPRKIVAADFTAIDTAFVNKGYSRSSNYTTSDESSIYFSNSSVDILVGSTVGEAKVRATVTEKSQ